jgi:hypothetical protein
MMPAVMEHLNRSIQKVDENVKLAQTIDLDLKSLRTKIFIKNTKNFADANESLWDRIANAHKNKK